jgi:hypothetical protein
VILGRDRNLGGVGLFKRELMYGGSVVAAICAALLLGAPRAAAASAPVSVFPSPSTSSALPGTQITFRGVAPSSIGPVQVVGSSTGAHTGHIAADADDQGGSFIPDTPFVPGETVTVSTGLNVLGGVNGTFRFGIVHPAGPSSPRQSPIVAAGANGVRHFVSRPDLVPARLTFIRRAAPAAFGDIFVAPEFGPVQNGPMLLDPAGNLIWFYPLPAKMFAADFRVQQLWGQSVLTWWQGYFTGVSHVGEDVIFDQHYQPIATVSAGNGLQADLHEFLVTPEGQAWIVAVSPVVLPGFRGTVLDSVVQEIDIKTGLVMFEWHALDHVPFSESFFRPSKSGYDPYHLNSIAIDRDGNPIVSVRNTWAAYKIDLRTGAVIWTLGSSRSSFKMGAGTRTAFQHDLVVLPDGSFLMFDDGGAPPAVHSQSRVVRIAIDTKHMTARLVKQYVHTPPLLTAFEGGVQPLPGGELFVGWGQQPYLTEFNAARRIDFDARFNVPTSSYRAYRFPWHGYPLTPPDIAVATGAKGTTTVYASWNGATDVSSWRVLAGSSGTSLRSVATAPKIGFETTVSMRVREPCFAVQALTSAGQVIGTSRPSGSSSACQVSSSAQSSARAR